jgi:hypothetical protein
VATYNKVAGSAEALAEGINTGSDQWAFALSNAAPSAVAFVAGTTDLATGGGYTQGGTNVTTTSSTEAAGVLRLKLPASGLWTASGGGFTFRYVLLVNKTQNLVPGYWDNGSSIVMNGTNADTFEFTPDTTNGTITVT